MPAEIFYYLPLRKNNTVKLIVFLMRNNSEGFIDAPYILLVKLALAERHSKNASVSSFFFLSVGPSHAFLAETVETGDKNRNDSHRMQISLVMSMRYIFGDD